MSKKNGSSVRPAKKDTPLAGSVVTVNGLAVAGGTGSRYAPSAIAATSVPIFHVQVPAGVRMLVLSNGLRVARFLRHFALATTRIVASYRDYVTRARRRWTRPSAHCTRPQDHTRTLPFWITRPSAVDVLR